jgi:tetratricopeptide (TPR) repeat protein
VTGDNVRAAVEALRERLNSISEIVEERITDEGLQARLRRLKSRTGDHRSGFLGRDALLEDLQALMREPRQGPAVLVGPGGAGKTTVAAALAERVRIQGGQVWWLTAVDPVLLSQGLAAVTRQLGGAKPDVDAIAWGDADAADHFWRLLDHASQGWLLVFDEADDPGVLSAGNSPAGVQDLTGWVRSSARGMAVVTSRETDPRMWGAAKLMPVGGLDENHAARVLQELAPAAGDHDEARALARHLAGHPLNLHLAGRYLCSPAARRATFAAYERTLVEAAELHARNPAAAASPGILAARAVELSLDGLEHRGVICARPVLQVASCYASAAIPKSLLDADILAGLSTIEGAPEIRHMDEALRGLREVGLIRDHSGGGFDLHPVITAAGLASLGGSETGSDLIRHTAVALLAADVGSLPHDRPEAWPDYLSLGPLLLGLLETTANRVDRKHLILLLDTADRMAYAFYQCGESKAGSVLCERALAHSTALGNTHLAVLRLRHNLAWALADRGNLDDAEALYRDVLRLRLPQLGPKHPDVFRGRHELAWIAGCRGNWAEAEEGYWAVLRDSLAVQDSDDPDILLTRHELGWAIANRGRLDEAREVFRAVLADRVRVLGAEHHRTLATQHELAWITAREGEWAIAETDYSRIFDLRRQLFGDDHPATILTRHELAWIAARLGRAAEAEAGYADVLERRRRILGEDHPQTCATREALDELRHGRIVDASHLT